ncbi:MAG: L-arabinose isomerase, partial [Bacillota bacterium]
MKRYRYWFVVGSQHLYGDKIFKTIETHAKAMVETMNKAVEPFAEITFKGLVKTSEEIETTFKEANQNDNVAGVITWMHTFSPSKM